MAGINIAVDAMGGDNAPAAAVSGCIAALDGREGFTITVVGREYSIHNELQRLKPRVDHLKSGRLVIRHAAEVIATGDAPVSAIKEKKNSSMVVCLRMVKEGVAQAAVSAGNTGALLTGGLLIVGRVKGILRPALGVLMPANGGFGYTLLIDAGANMDSRPAYLAQFARMGSVYVESLFDIPYPRVGLINVGVEAEKGNALVKEAFGLLHASGLNFIGNMESRELSHSGADVAVCDGFVGNLLLKHTEGMAKAMFSIIRKELKTNVITKAGALLSKKAFTNIKTVYDPSEVGGAPFLGLTGLIIKAHGNAGKRAFMNAVLRAVTYNANGAQEKLINYFANHEGEHDGT
ncbi:MAG: phosphate acyltransferase PlsX [Defluviitaleaceae bacterium]|nr:phosphate acyltransferase PlsX [Defluviitaleaceae bacterium]MCL2836589.1 phosphate acyltransferase PlsX [Defluviitaleaceae bacterium]